jgi:hypothetical protein
VALEDFRVGAIALESTRWLGVDETLGGSNHQLRTINEFPYILGDNLCFRVGSEGGGVGVAGST